MVLFAVLTVDVHDGGTFSWDRSAVEYFDEHYYDLSTLRAVAEALVYLSIVAGAVFAIGLLVLLAAAREWRRALFWGLTVVGALVLTRVLKELIARPEIGVNDTEYSFPSGNGTASMAGLIALVLLLQPGRLRRIVAVAGAVVIPLYGSALVLLLWHYPSDVVAGWALGLGWVLALRLALGDVSGPLRLPPRDAHPFRRSSAGPR